MNISSQLLTLHGFAKHLWRIFQDTGAQPEDLMIEITEAALYNDPQPLAAAMRATREWGIGFSVDEFGSGHASSAQLKPLPVDTVKSARAPVAEVPGNDTRTRGIDTALRMAGSLGIGVAAKGIDTNEQLNYLRSHGCRLFQGSRICAPLAEEALVALLPTGRTGLADETR